MIAAFDLGGTHLRSALASSDGSLHAFERVRTANAFGKVTSAASVWASIVDRIDQYTRTHARMLKNGEVIISFPGPIVDNLPVKAPTISGEYNVSHIAETLHKRIGRPTKFLNDVSAAAWYLLDRIADDRFMVVTVSSGIGSKVVDRSSAPHVFDDVEYSGEIGHMLVDTADDAPKCDCGSSGHLGAIASGRGTEHLAKSAAKRNPIAFASSLCASRFGATPATLNNEEHLVPAARLNDDWSWSVIRASMRPLAQVLTCVTYAVGLERIVIIGGFALEIGERYGVELTSLMSEYCARRPFGVPLDGLVTLCPAEKNVCLRGAVRYGRFLAVHS